MSQVLIDQAQKRTDLRVLTKDLSAGNVACALRTAAGTIITPWQTYWEGRV